jgi:hypothetical protein
MDSFLLSQNRSHCQTRAASPVSNWNAFPNRHSQETQIKAFAGRGTESPGSYDPLRGQVAFVVGDDSTRLVVMDSGAIVA